MKSEKVVKSVFCMKCGKKMPDDARFCPQCGEKVTAGATRTNKCKECGSVMEYIEEEAVMRCSYCGRTELLHEDNEVKIQRIQSNAWKEAKYDEHEKAKEVAIKQEEEKSYKNELVVGMVVFILSLLFFVGMVIFYYTRR